MAKNHDFSNVVANCGATRIFTENPAVSLFIIYHWLTSCQKSKKSLEPISWKSDNQINKLTNKLLTTPGIYSPKGEN